MGRGEEWVRMREGDGDGDGDGKGGGRGRLISGRLTTCEGPL